MDKKNILKSLEELTEKLSISIRYGKLNSKGGFCRVYDKYYIFLDRNTNDVTKIQIITQALKKFDLKNIYIPPHIRTFIGEEE
jgi:N-acetylglucosamine kinase-like BadF-type ATPase